MSSSPEQCHRPSTDTASDWEVWLGFASQHVQNVLNDPRFYGREEALRRCSKSTGLIIKTTMWFDVLVSVTTQQVPRFLGVDTYRRIVNNALISHPLTGGAGGEEIPMSMLPVVGCENKVVLPSAETSNLAHCWKESMLRCGRLSYSDIVTVQRGLGIEEMYLARNTPVSPIVLVQPGMYGPPTFASRTADGHEGSSARGGGCRRRWGRRCWRERRGRGDPAVVCRVLATSLASSAFRLTPTNYAEP